MLTLLIDFGIWFITFHNLLAIENWPQFIKWQEMFIASH
jgi:hypothetical protein